MTLQGKTEPRDQKSYSTQRPSNCLICNLSNYSLLYNEIKDFEYSTYKPVDYFICNNCGLITQYPLPDINLLSTFYPSEYRNFLPQEETLFSSLKNIQFITLAKKITRYIKNKNAKILEVGPGNGNLLSAMKLKGYENLYGIDFKDNAFKDLEKKGIKTALSNIEEGNPFNEKFDVVIMNNVIEHFLNPFNVLRNLKKSLSKDGKIILITPNSNAIELLLFKNYWAGFHAPRHIYLFNDKNIRLLAQGLDFLKVIVKPIVDPGQWSISIQNIFQDKELTKTKLKNGMAWYLMPLSLVTTPVAISQNLIGRSTSMMCVLEN